MSSPIGGIDPHQDSFTVGVVDGNGAAVDHASFPNSTAGYLDAVAWFTGRGVEQVGIEGSASWGAHVAIAMVAVGFDAREVPPSRSAANGGPAARTRPTGRTPSPPLERCWLNRPSDRSKPWRSTTRWSPTSKPSSSTAA